MPAVQNRQARVLILGSMPGEASLLQQQYYAHPRNAFWPLMASLLGFSAQLKYQERLSALQRGGIALWDVIDNCLRQGSLDSAIRQEQVNNFEQFFTEHPAVRAVAFNGAKALQSFRRQVMPVQKLPADLILLSLPSTSPAHASLSFEQKKQQWQQILDYL